MDNVIVQELKQVVEQAVQPVWATVKRKLRMREELLAHLTAIFEEEVERLHDDRAALEQAVQRFGDPRELTAQLQESVPRSDRYWSIIENMGCQPGESAWHLAGKYLLIMFVLYTFPALWISVLLVLGKMPNFGPLEVQHELAIAFGLGGPAAALFNVFIAVLLASLLYKIGPALTSHLWGRFLLVLLCLFVVLCGLSPVFTGVALLFLLMAHQAFKQHRYKKGWV